MLTNIAKDDDMAKKAYTLKKMEDTDELHLFEGTFSEEPCTSGSNSLCRKMTKNDSAGNVFMCYPEDNARIECAKIGRKVCGVCISKLYTTYN
jgi:hypothetical protein